MGLLQISIFADFNVFLSHTQQEGDDSKNISEFFFGGDTHYLRQGFEIHWNPVLHLVKICTSYPQ